MTKPDKLVDLGPNATPEAVDEFLAKWPSHMPAKTPDSGGGLIPKSLEEQWNSLKWGDPIMSPPVAHVQPAADLSAIEADLAKLPQMEPSPAPSVLIPPHAEAKLAQWSAKAAQLAKMDKAIKASKEVLLEDLFANAGLAAQSELWTGLDAAHSVVSVPLAPNDILGWSASIYHPSIGRFKLVMHLYPEKD